jgi:formylglycine-generating enzyme required for sulfatase activity
MGLARRDRAYEPAQGQDRKPVRAVSHAWARTFCRWLSRRTGMKVALPGEVEWEYAARGPQSPVYPWGDDWDDDNACAGASAPDDVGSHPSGRSWCGADDMAGNVFEWCADRWEPDRYKRLQPRDPPPIGAGSSAGLRVIRGGCYGNDGKLCASAYRNAISGSGVDPALGFRVMISATGAVMKYDIAAPHETGGDE